MQYCAARHHYFYVRTGCKDFLNERSSVHDLLKVIQKKEKTLITQGYFHWFKDGLPAYLLDAQLLCDRRDHQVRFGNGRQVNNADASSEVFPHFHCNLPAQTSFANPASTQQSHQANFWSLQHLAYIDHVLFASDERRKGRGHLPHWLGLQAV